MELFEQVQLATNQILSGNTETGLNRLKMLERDHPRDGNLNYALGFAYRRSGELRLSEFYLKKAIELAPGFSHYHTTLGITQQEMGNYPAAIDSLKKAMTMAPERISTYNSLGYTYKLQGEYRKALDTYSYGVHKLFEAAYDQIISEEQEYTPFHIVEDFMKDYEWLRFFSYTCLKRATKEGMERISWLNGESATALEEDKEERQKLFKDINGVRVILPNFFQSFPLELKSAIYYSTFLNNVAGVYAAQGRKEKAKKIYKEAILFTPEGMHFKPPHQGLRNLENTD